MADVIVAGPEGSGTHMLTDLLRAAGADAEQRSLPYAAVWWILPDGTVFDPATWEPFPELTRFVVIERDARCTVASVMRRCLSSSAAAAEVARSAASSRLASLPALRVSYEAIVADPRSVVLELTRSLGLPDPGSLPEVRDENRKWLDG